MKPINDDAKLFVQELENSVSKAVPIQWIGNRLVIIDNWYVLHGQKQLILLILIENYLDFIEHKMSWEKADLWPKAVLYMEYASAVDKD